MKATIYTEEGEEQGETELPEVFNTSIRPDLVRKAFLSANANKRQRHGTDPFAGKRTSAESWGSGRGAAHVPRVKGGNRAARVPHAVGGRVAHPPKAEKNVGEDLNDKERTLAVRSAAAMTTDPDLVRERGHRVSDDLELPIVVSGEFEDLVKTGDVASALKEIGVHGDIDRADNGRGIRSGRGKMRGRKYRTPRSILFVSTEELRAARNLAGADIAAAPEVDILDLAPGGVGGRLTVWTEPALEVFSER